MDIGVIFDMDGTLIDNLRYHLQAFREMYKRYGIPPISDDEFLQYSNGRTNDDVIRYVFGSDISQVRVNALGNEKEEIYRELYRPHMQLSKGLQPIIEELHRRHIPMAVGSSAIDENIDFILDGLDIRHYFKAIVNAAQVVHGKPHPEVFLKCAAALDVPPQRCVVCEDAVAGVEAGIAADAKVIAIASIMPRAALSRATRVIDSFEEITAQDIVDLAGINVRLNT
jgi:beta-phosphoglucomutase family hydrolase